MDHRLALNENYGSSFEICEKPMKAIMIVAVAVALIVGGGFAWRLLAQPAYSYRYKMTIDIVDGNERRSGESVIEIQTINQPKFGSAPPRVSHVTGEATAVDLGDGRFLIGLLAAGPHGEDINHPYNLIPQLLHVTDVKDLERIPQLHGRFELPRSLWPTFVVVNNPSDPSSIVEVRPEDLEKVLGRAVSVDSVAVTLTKDSISKKIESQLPMLVSHRSQLRQITNDLPPRFRPHFHLFKRGA